jgi:hypothetical protein
MILCSVNFLALILQSCDAAVAWPSPAGSIASGPAGSIASGGVGAAGLQAIVQGVRGVGATGLQAIVQGVRGCRRGGLAGQGVGACRCRRCRCMHCSDGQEARRRRDGAEAAATGAKDSRLG